MLARPAHDVTASGLELRSRVAVRGRLRAGRVCGGSSSETPPPLQPDPGFHYAGVHAAPREAKRMAAPRRPRATRTTTKAARARALPVGHAVATRR